MDAHVAQTVRDIKSLKIQGAQAVAKAAVTAAAEFVKHHPNCSREKFLEVLAALEEARPTEPALRNALQYFILRGGRENPVVAAREVLTYFADANKKIVENFAGVLEKLVAREKKRGGARAVPQIFTHCHSSTVTGALIAAHKSSMTAMKGGDGRRFIVANTETRPLMQGRKTALELTHAGIDVLHGIDSEGRLLIKDSAAVLFGSDAILHDGTVINKIGSEMFAEVAVPRKIPVYVLSVAFKYAQQTAQGYDQTIEERSPSEVWRDHPQLGKGSGGRKGSFSIINYAFERIKPQNITAIVSELGVLSPRAFVKAVRHAYPWMLNERYEK